MGDVLANLVRLLPFGYAFGAGVLTMLSPCSVALLPSYVSMHLGIEGEDGRRPSPLRRWGRAMLFSLASTGGIAILFAAAGLVVSLGGRFLAGVIPWLAVAVGIGLVIAGVWLLAGGHVQASMFSRLAGRLGRGAQRSSLRFLLFGLVYGIGALSCTFPVFLAVVGSAISMSDPTAGFLQFVAYAVGMGMVMLTVTIAVALLKEGFYRRLASASPYVMRLSGLLLVGSGGYVLYYWTMVGGLLR